MKKLDVIVDVASLTKKKPAKETPRPKSKATRKVPTPGSQPSKDRGKGKGKATVSALKEKKPA